MTREEALAMYRPIRASARRISSAAFRVCNHSDLMRAAKQLGLWADGKIVLPEDDEAATGRLRARPAGDRLALSPPALEAHMDRAEALERVTPFLFVGNNRYQASGLGIGRRARLDSGRLWICPLSARAVLTLCAQR